ncbi:spore germination protein [Clostridium sp. JNZ X4-2]
MNNLIKKIFSSKKIINKNIPDKQSPKENPVDIDSSIEKNKSYIESCFSNCFDLVIREISLFNIKEKKALIVYLEGFSKKSLIENFLIAKLTSDNYSKSSYTDEIQFIKSTFGIKDENIHTDINKSIKSIVTGNPVVFIDGLEKSFEIDLNNPPKRNINEPPTDSVLRGPREGFTESLIENINLIRKKIKNPNLKMEKFILGKETHTDIIISYISGVTDNKIVEEVKKRLKKIDVESVLDSNYIEEYISDEPLSIYPLVFKTEKPDIAASKLLEGKIIIIVDGSPVALSVPTLFVEFFQSGEDYYIKYSSATLNRIIRCISLITTIALPAIYVALNNFHQELIPTKLIISIVDSRSSVPLPALWESFFMLVAFEIMREAGMRMPKTLGPAISIVGGLVLGDAAVNAGIVGSPIVVIVSLTAITKFTVPSIEFELPIVYIRFFFLFLSGYLGLIGLTCGILLISTRLSSIRCFGIPYMFPIFPFNIDPQEDQIMRSPIWKLNRTQKSNKLKNNFISNRIHKHTS